MVSGSPARITRLLQPLDVARRQPHVEVWSPASYLWHLVDVLRIGAERLLALSLDPSAGIPCWDENALAETRRYERLSPRVALVVYPEAVTRWVEVATSVEEDVSAEHPEFGTLTAVDIVRRNAHEVCHHELDIARGMTD